MRTEVVPAGGDHAHEFRPPGGFKDGQLRLRPRPSHGIVVGRQGQERRAKSTPGTLVPSLKRHGGAAERRDARDVDARRRSAPRTGTDRNVGGGRSVDAENGRGYRGDGRGYRGNGRGYRGNGRHRGTGRGYVAVESVESVAVAPPSRIRIREAADDASAAEGIARHPQPIA